MFGIRMRKPMCADNKVTEDSITGFSEPGRSSPPTQVDKTALGKVKRLLIPFGKKLSGASASVQQTAAAAVAATVADTPSSSITNLTATESSSSSSSMQTLGGGVKKTFGVPLDALVRETSTDGVPVIVSRLCHFIQVHGLHCEGLFRLSANQKVVERLYQALDQTEGEGDFNVLEATGDVVAAAALLKLFLRELPTPLVPYQTRAQMLNTHLAYRNDESEYLCRTKRLVEELPENNFNLLRFLLRFLAQVARCEHHNRMSAESLGILFGPNLFGIATKSGGVDQSTDAAAAAGMASFKEQGIVNELVSRLIRDYDGIFTNDAICAPALDLHVACPGKGIATPSPSAAAVALARLPLHNASELAAVGVPAGLPQQRPTSAPAATTYTPKNDDDVLEMKPQISDTVFTEECPEPHVQHTSDRKRKERHESSSQSHERKVIRSNSEERPLDCEITNGKNGSMRRVCSHEDFGNYASNLSFLQELHGSSPYQPVKSVGLPLHEQNPPASYLLSPEDVPSVSKWNDDGSRYEVELHRKSERFTTFPKASRIRRSRKMRVSSSRADDQENKGADFFYPTPSSSTSEEEYASSSSSSGTSPEPFEKSTDGSESTSPCASPSVLRRPTTIPPLDLASLHEQVGGDEPMTSRSVRDGWSFVRQVSDEDQVMLSPRNSVIFTGKRHLDPNIPPSPPLEQDVMMPSHSAMSSYDQDRTAYYIKKTSKFINSLKRKLKHFEESFEMQFGYRPSHADKMTDKDMKRCMSDLSKARKELKQLREDVHLGSIASSWGGGSVHDAVPNVPREVKMEDTCAEVQKGLAEKRQQAGRPDDVEEMTREQILDEKVAMQKALLYFESVHGRPTTKEEKDLMRPLYDRYRSLKRMVIKSGSSKSKESVVELATIHEHETMDFTQASLQQPRPEADVSDVADVAEGEDGAANNVKKFSESDFGENLHELSLYQLLKQQQTIRDEKKRLRHTLREFEEEFQRLTGRKVQRDDRTPMEVTYALYKQTKAKLRLIEALVAKRRSNSGI